MRGDGSLGFLVARGLLLREVVAASRPAAELVGPGDVIRPWPAEREELLERQSGWQVIEQSAIVDLDGGLLDRVGDFPQLVDALLERTLARTDRLLLDRAIASHVRVDVRLLACLWHLAERWGVVTKEGVRVDLPLTHAVLARLVGARRPTVTTALQRLIALGHARRDGRAFMLLGGAEAVRVLEQQAPSRDATESEAPPPGRDPRPQPPFASAA